MKVKKLSLIHCLLLKVCNFDVLAFLTNGSSLEALSSHRPHKINKLEHVLLYEIESYVIIFD